MYTIKSFPKRARREIAITHPYKVFNTEPVAKPIFNQIIHSLKYGTIKKL